MEKNIFVQKQFWKILFLEKKCSWIFCPQKVANFCSKKRNYKKNISKIIFTKKKLENMFLEKIILEIFFPCFHEGGGNYQAKSGMSSFFLWGTNPSRFRKELYLHIYRWDYDYGMVTTMDQYVKNYGKNSCYGN